VQTVLVFIILSLFWITLSGEFDAFHLALGFISILIVTRWTGKSLLNQKLSFFNWVRFMIKLMGYFGWQLYQVILANLHVIYVAIHPNMKEIINPKMIEFTTYLKSERAKFLLATSITLTPGTLTVRITDNQFLVHALTDKTANDCPGEMEKRIAAVFGESHG